MRTIIRDNSQRGAILIQVAIMILVLTAASAFVVDYGVMWLSRRQAQNAADAGALAGAVARAYDETTDPPSAGGPAYQAAFNAATANNVFGAVPGVAISWDCPSFIAGSGCVRVDVFRDGTNGSATLPTFFAPVLAVSSQRARATATAQAGVGNASDCMKPFAVSDKWLEEQTPDWDASDTFDRYYKNGPNAGKLMPGTTAPCATCPDEYTAPTETDPGTGFTLAKDLGIEMTLKFGPGNNQLSPGWFLPVDLPRLDGAPVQGGERFRDNIQSCNGVAIPIGTYLPTETGAKQGPTVQGMTALIAKDPGATWNPATNSVDNSCAPGICADGLYHTLSPRIVALPVFDPSEYQFSDTNNSWPQCTTGGTCVKVVNILGYFMNAVARNGDVSGYLMTYPGLLMAGETVGSPSAFDKVISLVR